MDLPKGSLPSFAFGPYQADLLSGELRKNGARTKIQDLPLRLLGVLAEKPGRVVTREELQKRLWPEDTFVDFEDGLNTAVKKLREALGDDAENPHYIETIPRRGYRFIADVRKIGAHDSSSSSPEAPFSSVRFREPSAAIDKPRSRSRTWMVAAATVLLLLSGLGFWLLYGRPAFSFSPRDSVLVTDFENETGDPRFDEALRTAFTVSLEQSRHANVFPRVRLGTVLRLMGKSATEHITPAVGREICQRENIQGLITGSITRTGQEYALSAELIDPQTGATVRSYMERSYGEDHILDALGVIAEDIRRDLGESLYQIHRSNRPLPEVTTSSLTALKQYAEGQSLWHRGKFDDAMTLFRAAVESDPDFAMAHAALGNGYCSYIYYKPDQGKVEYEKALSLTSRTTDRERLLIQTNFAVDQEHVGEAIVLYQTYLARYPDDWNVHLDYARILRLHDRQPEAIGQYEQVLRIAPDDARAYIEMATAYNSLGQFHKALDAYSQAFRLEPGWLTSGNINREYGFTLVELGQDDKAIQAFTTMLANPETRAEGLRSMGLLDLYHGRFAAGQRRLQEELRIQEARADVFDAARAHFLLAVIAEEEGDSRGQMEQLDASITHFKEIGPKVTWAALVGQEYARAGAVEKAEKLADMVAASVDQRNAKDTAYFRILQAEVALAKGDADAAIKGLLALGSGTSKDVRVVWAEALAHAYQQSGKTDQAIAWYEKLLAIPEGPLSWEPQERWLAAYYTLAADYASRGEKQKAQTTLAVFLNLWKNADADLALRKQALSLRARIS